MMWDGKRTENRKRMGYLNSPDINDELIINLRDLGHTIRFLYEGKGSQKRILIILLEIGDITQRDLTARLGIKPGSVSEVLAKMENSGLISRTAGSMDRRTADIRLTAKGRELAQEATSQRRQRHIEMFSCLSDKEKETLTELTRKICDDWKVRYHSDDEEK